MHPAAVLARCAHSWGKLVAYLASSRSRAASLLDCPPGRKIRLANGLDMHHVRGKINSSSSSSAMRPSRSRPRVLAARPLLPGHLVHPARLLRSEIRIVASSFAGSRQIYKSRVCAVRVPEDLEKKSLIPSASSAVCPKKSERASVSKDEVSPAAGVPGCQRRAFCRPRARGVDRCDARRRGGKALRASSLDPQSRRSIRGVCEREGGRAGERWRVGRRWPCLPDHRTAPRSRVRTASPVASPFRSREDVLFWRFRCVPGKRRCVGPLSPRDGERHAGRRGPPRPASLSVTGSWERASRSRGSDAEAARAAAPTAAAIRGRLQRCDPAMALLTTRGDRDDRIGWRKRDWRGRGEGVRRGGAGGREGGGGEGERRRGFSSSKRMLGDGLAGRLPCSSPPSSVCIFLRCED